MYLVVDANVLFSALIKESKTSELILSDKFKLIAPRYLFSEFEKYENLILLKTHRNKGEFFKFLSILKKRIHLVSEKEIEEKTDETENICPDEKDIPYFALALKFNCPLWSDDKMLEEQSSIKVFNTGELDKLNKYK